ncbi:MAG: bifunctional glutamate N-acetyltransferase/amino-acid acetyltransferase ArgJ [Candidatus Hydrogenedens sp.]|nr:bifunctional glutamate N-acetyltransferase/amino-acid acetyltransferase ArgJ [Candidatus Hydrogenedens sp.]
MSKAIEGGVCAPMGFRAAGVAAGIKKPGSEKKDCALIVSDTEATAAGLFTTNLFKAAPVRWTEGVCIRGKARAVFCNSGVANAVTGSIGLENAQRMAEVVAAGIDAPIIQVCVASTGVIGMQLPMDRIEKGIAGCLEALRPDGGADAARAIMTTDTVPKEMAVEVELSLGSVRIGAIAKGSGMINPNMATMLAYITTDAALSSEALDAALRPAVDNSFNCICVDNDMSTSDMVVCLANGAAGLPSLKPGTPDFAVFAEALHEVCTAMAQALVRDGEGASKFIEIAVAGAADDATAKQIARAIAQSQLCKTAFAGEDANWGRIACAAGYSGAAFNPERVSISLSGLEVVHEGLPTGYAETDAAARMKEHDIRIDIRVGDGAGSCVFWTSDLTHEYVSINADYRS